MVTTKLRLSLYLVFLTSVMHHTLLISSEWTQVSPLLNGRIIKLVKGGEVDELGQVLNGRYFDDALKEELDGRCLLEGVSKNGYTLLHYAAMSSDTRCLEYLLEYARILSVKREELVNKKGKNGLTAAHLAVRFGLRKSLHLLYKNGANLSLTIKRNQREMTLLDLAALNQNDSCLMFLLSNVKRLKKLLNKNYERLNACEQLALNTSKAIKNSNKVKKKRFLENVKRFYTFRESLNFAQQGLEVAKILYNCLDNHKVGVRNVMQKVQASLENALKGYLRFHCILFNDNHSHDMKLIEAGLENSFEEPSSFLLDELRTLDLSLLTSYAGQMRFPDGYDVSAEVKLGDVKRYIATTKTIIERLKKHFKKVLSRYIINSR